MILAIGTKSPPKVKAIKKASKKCVYFKWEEIEIISESVESWVSDMPQTMRENILWAQNRAINTKTLLNSNNKIADFYIWMEGWTTLIWKKAYIFWAVYIIDNQWNGHLGLSAFIEVPQMIQERIYDNNEELWPIMDDISWETNVKSKNWSVWHWTDDMLTREQEFWTTFFTAISPFYNKYYKL